MPAVHLDSVSFAYSSAVDVLTDVSLSLGPGWYGLVGENGAGKTTLLRLVLGDLSPTRGTVTCQPADAHRAHCPQIVDHLDPGVEAWAASWEAADAALRARLHLDPGDLARWATLSPGERRRWQLARAVASDPDVLCVDEPTNHLDGEASAELDAALEGMRGVGIIVSHDRRLLDRLTTATLWVERGRVVCWGGPYRVAAAEREALSSEAQETVRRLRAERDRTRGRLEQRRRSIAESQARDRRKRRQAGVSDPDARSIVVKGRQQDGAAAHSRLAGVEARHLRRVEEELGGMDARGDRGGPIQIEEGAARRRVLLSHEGPLSVGGRALCAHLSVRVGPETRLRVTGANGAGKSTLLASLLTDPPVPAHRVMWLPQELTVAQREGLLRRVRASDRGELGETMAVAARLGLDPERVLGSDLPSPGEARKLLIAEGLGRRVWVAVLDEATNHLDLPSIERLEAALSDYAGALVLVSHDDRFAAPLVEEELDVGTAAHR